LWKREGLHPRAEPLTTPTTFFLVHFVVLNVKLPTLKSFRQTSTVYCLGVLRVLKFVM